MNYYYSLFFKLTAFSRRKIKALTNTKIIAVDFVIVYLKQKNCILYTIICFIL